MTPRKIFLLIIVLVEWFALIAQLVLHVKATASMGMTESLIRFFSYFTILTNILVAVYTTALLIAPANKQSGFFFSASTQTAIALYIVVVGLIYNTVLRQLWDSSGLQAVVHDLLHTLAPALMLIFWWRWVNAKALSFSNIPAWLMYPAVYAIAVVVRGHIPNWYPYPFLDTGKFGYTKVLVNSAGRVVLFLVFSILFVIIGKRKSFSTR